MTRRKSREIAIEWRPRPRSWRRRRGSLRLAPRLAPGARLAPASSSANMHRITVATACPSARSCRRPRRSLASQGPSLSSPRQCDLRPRQPPRILRPRGEAAIYATEPATSSGSALSWRRPARAASAASRIWPPRTLQPMLRPTPKTVLLSTRMLLSCARFSVPRSLALIRWLIGIFLMTWTCSSLRHLKFFLLAAQSPASRVSCSAPIRVVSAWAHLPCTMCFILPRHP